SAFGVPPSGGSGNVIHSGGRRALPPEGGTPNDFPWRHRNEEVLLYSYDHRSGGAVRAVEPAFRRARLRTFEFPGRGVSESGGVRAGRRSDTERNARIDCLRARGAGAGRARILGGRTRHAPDRLFVRIAAVSLSQGVATRG